MGFADDIQAWAKRELARLRDAPVAVAIVAALGFGAGWWTASRFYAERFAVMQQRIDAGASVSVATSTGAVIGHGVVGESFVLTVDGAKLNSARDAYDVGFVVGVKNSAIDRFKDERIAMSSGMTIRPSQLEIHAKRNSLIEAALRETSRTSQPLTLWFELVLLPKGLDTRQIHTLSDVPRLGGRVVSTDGLL